MLLVLPGKIHRSPSHLLYLGNLVRVDSSLPKPIEQISPLDPPADIPREQQEQGKVVVSRCGCGVGHVVSLDTVFHGIDDESLTGVVEDTGNGLGPLPYPRPVFLQPVRHEPATRRMSATVNMILSKRRFISILLSSCYRRCREYFACDGVKRVVCSRAFRFVRHVRHTAKRLPNPSPPFFERCKGVHSPASRAREQRAPGK